MKKISIGFIVLLISLSTSELFASIITTDPSAPPSTQPSALTPTDSNFGDLFAKLEEKLHEQEQIEAKENLSQLKMLQDFVKNSTKNYDDQKMMKAAAYAVEIISLKSSGQQIGSIQLEIADKEPGLMPYFILAYLQYCQVYYENIPLLTSEELKQVNMAYIGGMESVFLTCALVSSKTTVDQLASIQAKATELHLNMESRNLKNLQKSIGSGDLDRQLDAIRKAIKQRQERNEKDSSVAMTE